MSDSRSKVNLSNYWENFAGNGLLSRSVVVGISIIVTLYFALELGEYLRELFSPDINDFGYSELMINYRDGFVRRGLLGEVIRFFSGATGISVIIVIQTICVGALVFVICYFFRRFYKMDQLMDHRLASSLRHSFFLHQKRLDAICFADWHLFASEK